MRRYWHIALLTLLVLLCTAGQADISQELPRNLWRKVATLTSVPHAQVIAVKPKMPDIWGEMDDLFAARDGGFYFRKDGLIYQFDGALTVFGANAGLENVLGFTFNNDTFYCLVRTQKKPLAMTLIIYSPLHERLERIELPKEMAGYLPLKSQAFNLKSGVIWCGDLTSGQVISWDGERWQKVDWELTYRDKLNDLSSYLDPTGTVWISGALKIKWNNNLTNYEGLKWGIIQTDGVTTLQLTLPDNAAVKFLAKDKAGYLWGDYWKLPPAEEYGLFRYKNLQFDYYPMKGEISPVYNKFIKGKSRMAFDGKGRLWVWWGASAQAPVVFTPESGFQPLPLPEFVPHNRLKAIIPSPPGYIWIVGEDFLTMINDGPLKDDNAPPETYLLKPPQEYIVGNSYDFLVGAGDYFTKQEEMEFSVRLDQRDWSEYVTNIQFPIPNLRDGPHKFMARARDRAGNVDPSPATVNFVVNPHKISLQAEKIEFATNMKIYSARHRYFKGAIEERGNLGLKNTSARPLMVNIEIALPVSISENAFRKTLEIKPRETLSLPFKLALNKNILVSEKTEIDLKISGEYHYATVKGRQTFTKKIEIEPPQVVYWDNPRLVGAYIQINSPQFQRLVDQIEREAQVFYVYGDKLTPAVLYYEALNVWGFQLKNSPYKTINPQSGYQESYQLPATTFKRRGGNSFELTTLYATMLANADVQTRFLECVNEPFLLVDSGLGHFEFEEIFRHPPFLIAGDKTAWLPVWVGSMADSFNQAVNEAWPLIDGRSQLVVDIGPWVDGALGLWPANDLAGDSFNLNSEALRVRLLRDVEEFSPEKYELYRQATYYLKNLSIFNTDLELKNTAAYFFTEHGYYNLAISILKRSFANPKLCANLGVLMLMVGNLTEAEHYLSLALSYNPENENVKQAMAVLNWQTTDLNATNNTKLNLAPTNYIQYWNK